MRTRHIIACEVRPALPRRVPTGARRRIRLAGGIAGALTCAWAHSRAQAQSPAAADLPLGLPPSAAILNTPTSGLGTGSATQQPAPTVAAVPPEGGQGTTERAWTFTPSVGLGELFNSNILQTESSPKPDFITAISPGLDIHGTTPRTEVNLQYHPTIELFARNSSQDSISQALAANGTATLVPDTLFINARGVGSVQPTAGGAGGLASFGALDAFGSPAESSFPSTSSSAAGTPAFSKQNTSQALSFSVTPYVEHRFGSTGTGKLGLTLTQSSITTGGTTDAIPGTVTTGTQHALTGEVTAQFQTGEDLGRVRDFVLLDASRSEGNGVESGAHNALATNWLGYAVTRTFVPFAELGAEDLAYNTIQHTHIQDAVWELGAMLTPNPDSQLSIGYGHRQGTDGFDARGYYALSARTRLTVDYTTGLTTDLQQLETQLGLADFDPSGNAVNSLTGAPLFLGNGLLSVQGALFHTRTLSVTATTVLDRNAISLSLQHQAETVAGTSATGIGVGQTGTTASATWTHDVSERTRVGFSGSYTLTSFETTPSHNESLWGGSAGITYLLSETLSSVARYVIYERASDYPGRSFAENIVLVGVTKRF